MKKLTTKILSAVFIIVLSLSSLAGCSKSEKKEFNIDKITVSASDKSRIEVETDDTLKEKEFVGSAAITINEDDIYSKSFGYADAVKSKKFNDESLFSVGHLTQNITGAAVLILDKSGKLSLDDTLDKYFDSKYGDLTSVTVEDLLSNRVNFGNYIYEISTTPAENKPLEKYVKSENPDKYSVKVNRLVLTHILKHGFSKRGNSAQSNYFLLGKIITKASGTSYRDYIKKSIFDKLGMKNSMFVSGKNKLAGYDMNNKVWRRFTENPALLNFGYAYSAFGMVSCSKDMSKFYKALVNGTLGGINYLKEIKLAPSNTYCGFTQDGNNITASARVLVHCDYVHINIQTKEVVLMMSNRVGKTDIKNTGDELYKILSSKINGIILANIK